MAHTCVHLLYAGLWELVVLTILLTEGWNENKKLFF